MEFKPSCSFLLIFETFSLLSLAILISYLTRLYKSWKKCQVIRKKLHEQGIDGPPPSFFYGNLPELERIQSKAAMKKKLEMSEKNQKENLIAHDYTSSIFPHFDQWRKQYGSVYTYSTGLMQHVYVNHPDIVKELNQTISLDLGKPSYFNKTLAPLLGNGVIRSNGHLWAQQRKILAPEFFMNKVKEMVGLMVESTEPLLRKWEGYIEASDDVAAAGVDIEVEDDLRGLSADVIARACFGTSYSNQGKEIFNKLRSLQKLISKQGFLFSVTNFGILGNKKQNKIKNLEREIESLIWQTVKEREQQCVDDDHSTNNLLQSILNGALNDYDSATDKVGYKNFVVDNCKNIYFAGHESTAISAAWCLMLLSLHPEWQTRIREEVAEHCHDGNITADSLPHLKTVTMVIQETLRLYPPGAFVTRLALEETRIGKLTIPKGVNIWTLIPTLHRDPEIWGPDSNQFKPERFIDGVSKACKLPQAYCPFGLGHRLCLGKNFAMVQLKVVLSLIVSKFAFSLSPSYRHSPTFRMIVGPEFGVQICIKKL
ncbi:hypothetical protein ACFE04_009078 [Oxalis oulophora]